MCSRDRDNSVGVIDRVIHNGRRPIFD
jgi:hypothetical protein